MTQLERNGQLSLELSSNQVEQDTPTEEQIREKLIEMRQAKIVQCEQEIAEILNKYRCALIGVFEIIGTQVRTGVRVTLTD